MTSAVKVSSAVSARYANALIDLAEQAKKLDKVEQDLIDLATMIAASEDLAAFMISPLFSVAQQRDVMSALASKAKFQDLTANFLSTLIKNRRLYAARAVIKAFHEQLSKRRGEITVSVTTAQDLSAKQAKALQDSISKSVGRDVSLQAKVEPGILGGMIVTVGSQMIDDSVIRKLERLKAAMGRQANQNLDEVKEA